MRFCLFWSETFHFSEIDWRAVRPVDVVLAAPLSSPLFQLHRAVAAGGGASSAFKIFGRWSQCVHCHRINLTAVLRREPPHPTLRLCPRSTVYPIQYAWPCKISLWIKTIWRICLEVCNRSSMHGLAKFSCLGYGHLTYLLSRDRICSDMAAGRGKRSDLIGLWCLILCRLTHCGNHEAAIKKTRYHCDVILFNQEHTRSNPSTNSWN